MEDVRGALAANLAELRKEENLTQAEFAARFNYSDKAVSKWERGDSLPDVVMLKTIADLYGLRLQSGRRQRQRAQKRKREQQGHKPFFHFAPPHVVIGTNHRSRSTWPVMPGTVP